MARTSVTTWIPTAGTTVTRNGETSFVDLFNNNMLNQNNFTLFVEGYLIDGTTTNLSVGLSDTTATGARANDIGFIDGIKASFTNASTVSSSSTSLAANSVFKFAIQRSGTSVKFFRNGIQIWTTQTIPVTNYRYLVVNNGGSTYAIDKIFLFNRTLTDLECIDITDGVSAPVVFESEYLAVLTEAATLGYALPSNDQQLIDNSVIKQLKDEGIWSELDLLYMFKRSSSESNFAKLNWKSPSSYLLTSAAPPTFEDNQGFKGNTTTMYFNTQYTPSTNSVKALLNNICVFTGVYSAGTVGASYGTRNTSANCFNSLNTGTTLNAGSATLGGSSGWAALDMLNVKDGTTHNCYVSGTFSSTTTYTSSSLSTVPLHLFALNNNGVIQNFNNNGFKYFGIGSKLVEAKALRLYQILNNI